ncbi:MAG: TonB-dependent receptor [Gammaproteobacteria bacterium]|nr:TonB-dependent receptor [Gammaproteobacteria bacterium]
MRSLTLLVFPALVASGIGTAIAQEEGRPASRALDEVVVTAQRREQLLQQTPVAVTALGRAEIEDQLITTTQDIGKTVPNLQLIPVTANPSAFQVGLRGGSEQAGGLIVSEPVVGIYVDDVYRARVQGANLQLTDIERIEVLRGPQGTLYGRNTFSGAIRVVTRTPSPDEQWLNAAIGFGSFGETNIRGSVGGGLTDQLGASVAFLYRDQSNGWIYNRALDQTIGEEENIAFRTRLAWRGDAWSAVASFDYGEDKNDGYIPVIINYTDGPPGQTFATRRSTAQTTTLPGFDEYVTQTPIESRGETEQWGLSLDLSRDFGAATFRSITAYREIDDYFRWDLTGGIEAAPGVYLPGFDRQADASADQFSQELQLIGEALNGRLDWIGGLYFFQESGTQVFTDAGIFFAAITGSPFAPLPLFEQETDTRSIALFGQGTYQLTDRLNLTAGLRYTRDRKKFDATIAPPVSLAVDLNETFEAWTPKFGLEYGFTDDLFGYVAISRGFKAGGFNGLDRNPDVLATPYRPQFSWTYEAGLKADWLDGRVRTNATVFLNQLRDLQQVASAPGGAFPVQNVGNARLFGVELEVSARPVDGLTLFANVGYMDDKYGSLNPGASAAVAGAVGLPLVADWTVQLGAVFERRVGDYWLRVGGDYRYIDDYFVNVQNNLEIEGYGRLDGFVALRTADERWELAFEGRNLTNDASYVSGALIDALTIIKPRTVMLSLRYRRE